MRDYTFEVKTFDVHGNLVARCHSIGISNIDAYLKVCLIVDKSNAFTWDAHSMELQKEINEVKFNKKI